MKFTYKRAITHSSEIPTSWIFEHFLNIDKLTGKRIAIKSVFNPSERTPSMYIYPTSKGYRFHCFSTGKTGTAYDLIMMLHNLDFTSAFNLVRTEYLDSEGLAEAVTSDPIEVIDDKWTVSKYKDRCWRIVDVGYWANYNIGSKLLDKYFVRPLQYVVFTKGMETLTISTKPGKLIYGYFTAAGLLYKIYMPGNSQKFWNIYNVIQGYDQCSKDNDTIFICSSLKDIMSLDSLGIKANFVAPSSENSKITGIKDWVQSHRVKYTIFDNDVAGINAMHNYEKLYDIPYLLLPLSKDISDSVKDYGAVKVKAVLLSMFNK